MDLQRRRVLQLLGGAAAGASLATAGGTHAHAAGVLYLVRNGSTTATVIVDGDADDQTRAAAQVFVDYVAKATGARIPVVPGPPEAEATDPLIFVGSWHPSDAARLADELADLDGDGYLIQQTGGDRLTIVGPTAWGTQFGVLEALERFLGISWLQAGPQGEDVPVASDVRIPQIALREEPKFASRLEYPDGNGYPLDTDQVTKRWSAFNRLHYRIQVGQNGYQRIFPVSVYGDPDKPATYHPEIYPIHNGERVLPRNDRDFHWQPDFSQQATEDIAVAYALNAFARGSTSLSLSINDVAAFSENNIDLHKINMYGFASVSEVYYAWCNRVAERVTAEYPDAQFGVLAYKNTVDPPSFDLHPSIIPFLTVDRYRWSLRSDEELDKDLTTQWLARTSRFGWYDWAYGNSYVLPRVDHTVRGTALRWAAKSGVHDIFSELGYSWGEGAKAWVLAKLWWDPERSADRLTADWCQRAAGRGAGPLLAWHQLWERTWTQIPKRGSTDWYRVNQTGPAAGFTFPGYLEDISLDVVAQGRQLLQKSRQLATEPDQQARVDLLIKAYDLYEATAQSYSRSAAIPRSNRDATDLIDQVIARLDTSVSAAHRRYTLIAQYQSDPLLRSQRDPRNQGLNWSGWMPNELWAIGTYLQGSDADVPRVRERIDGLTASATSARVRAWAAMAQAIADHRTVSLGTNTGFETGERSPWQVGQGILSTGIAFPPTVDTTASFEGEYGLRTPLVGGAIVQFVDAKPGFFRAAIHYRTPSGQPTGPDQVVHTWFARDDQGRNLRLFRSMPKFLSDTNGKWAEIAMQEFLPAGTTRLDFYCSLFNNTDAYARGELQVDGAQLLQLTSDVGIPPGE